MPPEIPSEPAPTVASFLYRYELRRNEELLATGHLSREGPLEVGDTLAIGRSHGIVRSIDPSSASRNSDLSFNFSRRAPTERFRDRVHRRAAELHIKFDTRLEGGRGQQ